MEEGGVVTLAAETVSGVIGPPLKYIALSIVGVIMLLYYLWRNRKIYCHFCEGKQLVDKRTMRCLSCDQVNDFAADGNYAYDIPEQRFEHLNVSSNSLQAAEFVDSPNPGKKRYRTSGEWLCAQCLDNQQILLERRSKFIATSEDTFDVEFRDYMTELETVYGLCQNCNNIVRDRLVAINAHLSMTSDAQPNFGLRRKLFSLMTFGLILVRLGFLFIAGFKFPVVDFSSHLGLITSHLLIWFLPLNISKKGKIIWFLVLILVVVLEFGGIVDYLAVVAGGTAILVALDSALTLSNIFPRSSSAKEPPKGRPAAMASGILTRTRTYSDDGTEAMDVDDLMSNLSGPINRAKSTSSCNSSVLSSSYNDSLLLNSQSRPPAIAYCAFALMLLTAIVAYLMTL